MVARASTGSTLLAPKFQYRRSIITGAVMFFLFSLWLHCSVWRSTWPSALTMLTWRNKVAIIILWSASRLSSAEPVIYQKGNEKSALSQNNNLKDLSIHWYCSAFFFNFSSFQNVAEKKSPWKSSCSPTFCYVRRYLWICVAGSRRKVELERLFDVQQCFSTAGPQPGTGPWHQLYRPARGSPGICHFSFLSIYHE